MARRRILVVKLSSLGDTLHALPAAAELARQKDAELDWAVQPAFAPLVERFACVSRVIPVPRPSETRAWLRALRELHRAPPYDLVVDFQGLLKSALVARAARAPRRIGPSFAREGSAAFYTELAGHRDKSRHAVEECLDVVRHLGLEMPARPLFPLRAPDVDPDSLAPAIASRTGPRIAVAPYSRWATKNWPESSFAEAIRILAEEADARIYLVGGPGDAPGAARIAAAAGVPCANLCGALSLVGSAGLLARCGALLTNDSGPMHIAAALGVPCVVPFGPTDPARTGPYGPGHIVLRAPDACPLAPCRKRACPRRDGACLAAISPRRVADAVLSVLPKP